jgi:hypothetical protein
VAKLRLRLVEKEIKAVAKLSQRLKHLLREKLEAVEADAASFPELDCRDLPSQIADKVAQLDGVAIRKVSLIHQRHNYRLLFLHREYGEDREDEAIFFVVIPRKTNGYDAVEWSTLEPWLVE